MLVFGAMGFLVGPVVLAVGAEFAVVVVVQRFHARLPPWLAMRSWKQALCQRLPKRWGDAASRCMTRLEEVRKHSWPEGRRSRSRSRSAKLAGAVPRRQRGEPDRAFDSSRCYQKAWRRSTRALWACVDVRGRRVQPARHAAGSPDARAPTGSGRESSPPSQQRGRGSYPTNP